ncbi:hypothetical protein MD535_05800 [Vibrio sp. ZSDZ65]|uniref:Uncharacterized protein n=1 Tax=Vibrio qingdaonensis TaxID=2829491 RepID=A0A9X3HVP2_9VIBR|nr:hypothetical protein [Vibrio qingdaonensis]MCW8345531.1 hypothetical protein [Vibrio qingdaonensis]
MLPSPKQYPKDSSEIEVSDEYSSSPTVCEDGVAPKLKQAYIDERVKLELSELELNRSRVVIMDQHGHVIKVPFLVEH